MDLQKEREAFESWLFDEYERAINFDIVFCEHEQAYNHVPTQARWETWQAAKAQAVRASINDIQSWIAVNSFSDLDVVHDNVQIVDANELAKYIDSLSLSVSVPEGFVLVPREPTEEMIQAGRDERRDLGTVASTYKAMIEAVQESTDDN